MSQRDSVLDADDQVLDLLSDEGSNGDNDIILNQSVDMSDENG